MVSHDSVAIDGDTSVQRYERETRNIDRQWCCNKEDVIQAAGANPPPLARNLQQEFPWWTTSKWSRHRAPI